MTIRKNRLIKVLIMGDIHAKFLFAFHPHRLQKEICKCQTIDLDLSSDFTPIPTLEENPASGWQSDPSARV